MADRARQALLDIRDNIRLAQEFVAGKTYAEFAEDRRSVYAVTRALEIVSEATRRLPDELCGRHPDLPWKDIRGAGNIYRHDYEDVLESMIWATVQHALAPLLAVVEVELAAGQD